MSASGEIGVFNKKLDELINSKYLLADGKVSEVLKAIASSELLYDIIAHFIKDYDYAAAKAKSLAETGGKGVFCMPEKDEDIIALVFSLLFEIDDKKEDLFALCNKYFYSAEGNQTSYGNFCSVVLVPFGEAVNKTAYKLINADFPEVKKRASGALSGLKIALSEEKIRLSSSRVSSEVKGEAEFILDKLLFYAEVGDEESMGVAFTALKYMNKSVDGLDIDTDGIIAEIRKINL
ncbi:MAG: hypothetical protein J5836_01395 [Clostridia bacterium]|nr:hypothetical protein [Clostridia bacterium]